MSTRRPLASHRRFGYPAAGPAAAPGFTLIELLVVISIIALLISILLPALGAARKTAEAMVCATRLRGYQQGLVILAQDNNGWYAGVNSDAEILSIAAINTDATYAESPGASNGARQAVMLSRNYITPEYAISPADEDKTPWDRSTGDGIKEYNISFSMLKIASDNTAGKAIDDADWNPGHVGRAAEWRDTFNGQAVVMSDRPISVTRTNASFHPTTGDTYSAHTEYTGSPNWKGHMVFNDNHVVFQSKMTTTTQYGDGPTVGNDHIFLFENNPGADPQVPPGTSAYAHEAAMVFFGHNQRFDPNEP